MIDDAGTYICEPPSAKAIETLAFTSDHVNSNSAVSMSVAWKKLSPRKVISYLVHLDITLPMKHMIVSNDDSDFPKPAPTVRDVEDNWKAYTHWEPWGKCNVCGSAGERRREGRCMVKMLDADKPCSPPHLDSILHFYPQGAPCHSTLFVNFESIVKRRNEIEVGSCRLVEECKRRDVLGKKNKTKSIFGAGALSKIIQIKTGRKVNLKKKKKKVEKKLTVKLGQFLSLDCPDTKPMTPVAWMNGSMLIQEEHLLHDTRGRVHLNVTHVLTFTRVALDDDNTTFSCWVERREERAVYHIKIDPTTIKEDVGPWLVYLFASYIFNIIAVLLGIVATNRPKTGQVTRK